MVEPDTALFHQDMIKKIPHTQTIEMTCKLHQITAFLAAFAPLELAESWDNVGLLLGDEQAEIRNVMTCLTLTMEVAEEAIRRNAQLIIAHHPILFRPVQRMTSGNSEGRMLLALLKAGSAVYSPHTAFDSARLGINQQLAERLQLQEIQVLRPADRPELTGLGAGRYGKLANPMPLSAFLDRVRQGLRVSTMSSGAEKMVLQYTGELNRTVSTVGIGCGSAAEFLKDAQRVGCDVFLTGEARFHACLEARDRNIALVQAGHYSTERPAVNALVDQLKTAFPNLNCWASETETDPVAWSIEQ